jgi:hypothetical protein
MLMKSQFGFNAAEYFARLQRISWKQAFGLVGGAPFRLHRYRDVHTQMLRDALCAQDCQRHADTCGNE